MPERRSPGPSPVRRATLLAVGVLVATLAVPVACASAAPAASVTQDGWLRLAHLSPNTPAVDVYLSGGGRNVVLRSVSYGTFSSYRYVPAGTYSATMRGAGSSASSAPVLQATARVVAGRAYTVAAVGLRDDLQTKVLSDDLTPPAAGSGKIRLIQASTRADDVSVTAVGGPTLAQNVAFGLATGYAAVPAGRWTLKVVPSGGSAAPLTTTVDIPAGRVSSVTVLDGSTPDSLVVKATTDSEGSAAVPSGGVRTGYGPGGSSSPADRLAVLGLLGTLAGAVTLTRSRRQRTHLCRAADETV